MTADAHAEGDAADRIRTTVRALDDAFNRADVDGVLAFYLPESVMVIQPGQLAAGHAALRNAFERLVRQDGRAEVQASKVLIAGDTALFVARWVFHRPMEDRRETHTATSVLRQGNDGEWKLLVDNGFGPGVLDPLE